MSALPLSEVQPRQAGGRPEWVIGGPWGPSQGQGGAALLSKTSRPVPGTSHNPSLVIFPEEWGSQQHVTDEETEAQRASLEVTQLRTGEVRFKPSPGVLSPLLVYTPPSRGQCHLEFSDSHSGDGDCTWHFGGRSIRTASHELPSLANREEGQDWEAGGGLSRLPSTAWDAQLPPATCPHPCSAPGASCLTVPHSPEPVAVDALSYPVRQGLCCPHSDSPRRPPQRGPLVSGSPSLMGFGKDNGAECQEARRLQQGGTSIQLAGIYRYYSCPTTTSQVRMGSRARHNLGGFMEGASKLRPGG